MKVKVLSILALVALLAACKNPGGSDGSAFTVTFNKNGGTTEAKPRIKKVTPPAETIDALPTAPTRTDYTFTGWNVQADGQGEVFSADTAVTADITVYAQWLYVPPGSFVVTFDRNGGHSDANPASKVVTPPKTTIDALPAPPTRTAHTFTGWNVKADGTGAAFTAAATVTADITVYAQWKEGASPVNPISPITYRNLFKELAGKTDAEVEAKVQGAYNRLFNGAEGQKIYYEVAPDMAYILDSGNNDVRSEGMSYAMMICVQMNDQARFDKIWRWARTKMYNDRTVKVDNIRGYFSWQFNINGTRKDANPAPDGEFYFVTALLFASARWGDGSGILEYGREARNILYDMIHRDEGGLDNWSAPPMFNKTHKMTVFSTIGQAANYTDPSYHLPAFYEVWAVEIEEGEEYWNIWGSEAAAKTDAQFYRDAATASRAFFPTTVHATTGLGPDYANFDGTPNAGGSNHNDFRYDAWRIAMNIGVDYAWWQKDPWQVEFADRIQSFFHGKGVTTYGSLWNLNGNGPLQDGNDHSPGLVACNAVASLAASHARRVDFINNFWNVPMTSGQYRYYDGCLYMLGMLHVSGNFKVYYPANRVRSSNIAPTTATFDKKAGAQADVTVTMTLNGNTLSNITGGSPAITSGNYTVSGNTVSIKAAYLAAQPNGPLTLTFTFSAGQARTIAITIGDTTGGGPIGGGGTEYNFATGSSVVVEGNRSGITGVVENGVLKINNTLSYQSNPYPSVVIPFNLGSATLGSFNKLEIKVKGTGDIGSKTLTAQVSSDGGTTYSALGTVSASGLGASYVTLNITIGSSSITGPIKISLSLGNTNPYVLEIESIKLLP